MVNPQRILALIRASVLTARRYKVDWYGNVVIPILMVLPAIIAIWYGKVVGLFEYFVQHVGTDRFIEYYILGAVFWNYVEAIWSSIFALRYQMVVGQLEEIFSTPITPLEYILGFSILQSLLVTITSLPLVIIGLGIMILSFSIKNVLFALMIAIFSILASFGFAFFFFGATLLVREGDTIVSLVGNMAPFIGGLYFPITLLPMPFRALSYVFPFVWGLDLLRHVILGTNTILKVNHELIVFAIVSILWLAFGIISYGLLEKASRKRGISGF